MVDRDLFHSTAFMHLCKKTRKGPLVLIIALSQLNRVSNRERDNAIKRTGRDLAKYKNGGRILLPQNLLAAYGITAPETAAR